MLNDIQKSILQTVSDMVSIPDGAVNIRLDGQKEFRQNSEHIQIVSKTDKDGIDIRIAPFTKSENVHIPVILSKSGFHDLVYNDFFVGEGADVTIVAGCGIHNCGDCDSEHDGIHTFYIGKNAKVHYIEKHYGEGEGSGKRILNPQTIVYLEEGASIVMDTSQIGGVDDTKRYTKCEANGANSEVQINEKLLTAGDQHAVSEMDVILNGEGSRTRVVSRSVAKEASTQIFYPRVQGNAPCFGHVSCDHGRGQGPLHPRDLLQPCRRRAHARGRHRQDRGRAAAQARDARPDAGGGGGEDPGGLPPLIVILHNFLRLNLCKITCFSVFSPIY